MGACFMALSPKNLIICGHYGAGKTNLSVNLALYLAARGEAVTVADLDLVNPYFRTADFRQLLAGAGVRLVAPVYANTNLDIPVVPPQLAGAIGGEGRLIIDVGGDDDGAVALGGYSAQLERQGYAMYYVINALREPDPDPLEEAALLRAVEKSARLKVTGLVNNTNLGRETTAEIIRNSRGYVDAVARAADLPVLFTAASAGDGPEDGMFPVTVYVKPPWEE